MDLARELRRLDVDWPETPELRLELAARPRRRWWPAVAVALAVAAIAAALAVPQSRGAILRFFHLGAAHIELVDTLPPAEQRSLTSGLGPVVPLLQAQAFLGRPLLLPPGPVPEIHQPFSGALAMVVRYRAEPVLLSEFGEVGFYKKFAYMGGTAIEQVRVGGASGVWLHGAPHVLYFQNASPRLAGNTLIWTANGATYRLEGRSLTKGDAITLAEALNAP
jgi:hypothetical protein